jgi:predicted transposase/invertase (TIGR01784 family)
VERQDPEQILKATVYRCVQHWLFRFLKIDSRLSRPLHIELRKRVHRVADILMELPDRILHIEIQTRRHKAMGLRMLQYWLLIQQQLPHKPIHQVVVYLTALPANDQGVLSASVFGKPVLDFVYQVINICELDENLFLESDDGYELILALLAKKKDKYQTIQKIINKLSVLAADREELATFVEDALTLARLRRLEGVFSQCIKPMPVLFKIVKEKDALYQFGKNEGLEQGLSKGLEQGLSKGLEQGIDKGRQLAAAVVRLYLKEHVSVENIAATLSLEVTTVLSILRESGLLEN